MSGGTVSEARKYRVLLVHNRYRQRAGEDELFDAETAMLRARGHDVSFYTADNTEMNNDGGIGLAAGAVWNRGAAADIRRVIGENAPEIVHFHNTQPRISPAACRTAAATGAAVVQTLHNYRITCVNALLYRNGHVCNDCLGAPVAWRGVFRRCYRGSLGASATVAATNALHRATGTWRTHIDAYIALSEFSRRIFVESGLPPVRIHVKGNFLPEAPPPRRHDEGYLLYAGRLSPEKGIDVLLDAWELASPAIELRIAGDGPLAGRVRDAQNRFANVRWLGRIERDKVMHELAGARAAVLPSTCYENFPMSLVEAGAAGVASIASDHGALAELIEDGTTGLLFSPGDASALARCLVEADREPRRLLAMGAETKRRFVDRFSEDAVYARLIEIYGLALDAARRRTGVAGA